jgi:hypothetical protein
MMSKHLADASGPVVAFTYFINNIIPVVQPVLIFIGVVASLVWYGIRFYDRYKYGPDNDKE